MVRGRGKRRIREGKNCVLCGGTRPSDTVEHAPPISLFRDKLRPQGYEFPACRRCNEGTAKLDALASFLFISCKRDAVLGAEPLREHVQNLARTVGRSFPQLSDFIENVDLSSPSGLITGRAVRLKLTSGISRHLARWSAKQVYAYWHEQNKTALSSEAIVAILLLTNDPAIDPHANEIATWLKSSFMIKPAGRPSNDQFFYRYGRDARSSISVFQAVFQESGGFFAVVDEQGVTSAILDGLPYHFKTSANRGIHCVRPHERSKLLFGSRPN